MYSSTMFILSSRVKRRIQLADGIMKEDLYTAYYAVSEDEEIVADRDVRYRGWKRRLCQRKMWLLSRRRMLR